MKILMLLDHEFPPDIRVENEIEALVENGHEVHVVCYTRKGLPDKEVVSQAIVHRTPISTFLYKSSVAALKFPFYFNFWKIFLNKLSKTEKFDAVHVHDLPMAKVGFDFAKKHSIPLTLDLHENWPALLRVATHTQSFLGKMLSTDKQWVNYELNYCKKADNIIVVVDEAKERLSRLGIDPKKVHVVSNTLNFEHFEIPETNPDAGYFTLLYAGGINKHRGLQYVISGLKNLQILAKPVRIWILGDGSYLGTLKQLAVDEKVSEMVDFKGWKNYSEMQNYFGMSDACLIPHVKNSHTDSTIPHKLFQYMYAGKPTIASNCAPIERIVNETGSGLIYEFDNPKDFAKKTAELLNNPKKMAEIVKNGKRAVEEKYNWENDKKVLQNIYK
jgi:glycosyltransferase involved in cell wall biosynthesis